MKYNSPSSYQEHGPDAASDMIDAVARVNIPVIVTSSPPLEGVDNRQPEVEETQLNVAAGKDGGQVPMTSLNRHSAGSVDILEQQIRHCASAGQMQDARRLMSSFRRKPLPSSSSGVFKSVASELTTETSSTSNARSSAGENIAPEFLPAVRRSSILSLDGAIILEIGSCEQRTSEVQFTRRPQEYKDVSTSSSLLSSNGGTWLKFDSTSTSREQPVKLTPKQYRSSPMCRRALYEKYLDPRDDWADGLTASGKQTLLDVQRRVSLRGNAHRYQPQSLWLLPGQRHSRSQTAQPATRGDPAGSISSHRRQAFSASSTTSSRYAVK